MGRKQRKMEKEIRARREAEAKIEAQDAKAKAEAERRENMTDAEKKEESKNAAIGCGLLAGVALLIFIFVQACGDSEEENSNASSSSEETTTSTPEPAELTESPLISGQQIAFAESRNDIRVEAVDIGPFIVDGVDYERGVLDRANWRIATYCPMMEGNRVRAGVIKEDEFGVITASAQGAGISENRYTYMIDCPGE